MGLQLLLLTADDLLAVEDHAKTFEPGDDLVGLPVPFCWPASDREQAQIRLRVHSQRGRGASRLLLIQ